MMIRLVGGFGRPDQTMVKLLIYQFCFWNRSCQKFTKRSFEAPRSLNSSPRSQKHSNKQVGNHSRLGGVFPHFNRIVSILPANTSFFLKVFLRSFRDEKILVRVLDEDNSSMTMKTIFKTLFHLTLASRYYFILLLYGWWHKTRFVFWRV